MTYKQAIKLCLLNILSYCLLAIDIRVTAAGHLYQIGLSNFIIGIVSYELVKIIADIPHSFKGRYAYAIGGSIGAVLGVWLTKFFL